MANTFVIREVNHLVVLSWIFLLYSMYHVVTDCRWINTLTQTSSTVLTYSMWHNETAGGHRNLGPHLGHNLGGNLGGSRSTF